MHDSELLAARRLREAEASRTPCTPVRELLPDGDLDAAYRVQQANVRLGMAAGRRMVGRKIGLTSIAVQKQLGVGQPDFGVLFADMACNDGQTIDFASILQPKIEAEIALVLGSDITTDQPTAADVVRATAYVVPCFEIVGSRIANWDITIVDTIADNASCGGFVLGGPYRTISGLDLGATEMVMRCNGEVMSQGTGAACLGNPVNAAVWLARRVAELDMPLRAGEIILTGALGPMVPVQPGAEFTASFSDIGHVGAKFA